MNKVKCAVIGVGYLGNFHAEKYHHLPEAELVAVCDTNQESCNQIAKKYKTKPYYDYRGLANQVTAVSIATPTTQHHDIAKFFLENNIHVLVEKPITTTVAEAENLIEIANKNNLILQVGHLERFNPALTYAEGQFENPRFIESIRLAPFKERGSDVNVILDLMIHDIDIIQSLIHSKIKRIDAIGAPVISPHYDITNARITFENGCITNVTASRVSIKTERKLRIFQHNAYMSLDLHNKEVNIYKKGKGQLLAGIPNISTDHKTFSKSDALKDEIGAFLNSIVASKPPVVSGEDGKNALATAIEITHMVNEYAKENSDYCG